MAEPIPTPASPGRIFISYRRQETAYSAGWLYDRLSARFGREQLFKDIDSIVPGDDFSEVIATAVGSCDVLLALIGDRWLTITDSDGRRRLDDADDFVRLEIEAALERNVRVIPILVEGATLPQSDELPASLAKLVRRQALELSPSRFEFDVGKLLNVLERTLAEAEAKRQAEARAEAGRQAEARAEAGREAEVKRQQEAGASSLAVSPTDIDFGLLPRQEPGQPRTIRLSNLPPDQMVRVSSDDRRIKFSRRGDEIRVHIDTSVVGEVDGAVTVESKDQRATTRIRAKVQQAIGHKGSAPAPADAPAAPPPKAAPPSAPLPAKSRALRMDRSTFVVAGITVVLGIAIALLATHNGGGSGGYIIDTGPKSALFSATSPWHVQVTGPNCWVAVKDRADNQVTSKVGSNQKIQVRKSGKFYLQGNINGNEGCNAVAMPGTGGTARLPTTIEPGAVTSLPFRSPGAVHITATPENGSSCSTLVYKSSDGTMVDRKLGEKDQTVNWEVRVDGEVWVEGDTSCTTRITGSSS